MRLTLLEKKESEFNMLLKAPLFQCHKVPEKHVAGPGLLTISEERTVFTSSSLMIQPALRTMSMKSLSRTPKLSSAPGRDNRCTSSRYSTRKQVTRYPCAPGRDNRCTSSRYSTRKHVTRYPCAPGRDNRCTSSRYSTRKHVTRYPSAPGRDNRCTSPLYSTRNQVTRYPCETKQTARELSR